MNDKTTKDLLSNIAGIAMEKKALDAAMVTAREELAHHIMRNEPHVAEAIVHGASQQAIEAAYRRVYR